jgi:Raf kinase inhibitor-like YbhB/YbcL family protein
VGQPSLLDRGFGGDHSKDRAMRHALIAVVAAGALAAAVPALAGGLISIQRPETATKGTLTVSSPAFKSGGPIPQKYSALGQNVSPPLSWAAAPAAKSYAILVDDPDAPGPTPLSHWVVWNIPPNTTMAPEGSKSGVQGTNGHNSVGYFGPHPPAGGPAHHYHFQVLALDRMLDVPAGAVRESVLAAAKGHVAAKGEVVGTFKAP